MTFRHTTCAVLVVCKQLCQLVADWIEHAAWTKGSNYLDTPVRHQPWYQQMLLDVWVFIIGCLVALGTAYKFGMATYRQYRKHLKKS